MLVSENFKTDCCRVATWNIAAVNNNPFEYWVTHPDPEYNALMKVVQDFIDNPGAQDDKLDQIFTNVMIIEFFQHMESKNLYGVDVVRKMWLQDYSQRKGVQNFLLDNSIGIKRLTSMPDRITNTIHSIDGSIAIRPSVISAYEGDMSSVEIWWTQWRKFIFEQEVNVLSTASEEGPRTVCELIEPILRSKYPAITAEEQAVSIPLQLLCLALFDATLVHILNLVSQKSWQRIKRTLSHALVKQKSKRTIAILEEKYSDTDVIFIQEAAAALYSQLSSETEIFNNFFILKPSVLDGKRDQNSFILASKCMFEENTASEVSDLVLRYIAGKWIAPGDLLAVAIRSRAGENYLLASFHGDSNGLSTQPFIEALDRCARERLPGHRVLLGLDANTLSRDEPLHFSVARFRALLQSLGMASCWDAAPDTAVTTCNARTCLQAQVNKSVRFSERIHKGQRNLKDWIVFYATQFDATFASLDNTGDRYFVVDMVFPTIAFPSDHALVSATLVLLPPPHLGLDLTEGLASVNPSAAGEASDAQTLCGDEVWSIDPVSPSQAMQDDLEKRRRWFQAPSLRRSHLDSDMHATTGHATLYDYWHIVAKPEELRVEENLTVCQSLWSSKDAVQQDEFFRMQYLDMTLRPPDALDRINANLSTLKNRAETVWILFASNPLSITFCKPKVILALCGPCLCVFGWVGMGFYLTSEAGYVYGASFRFTTVGRCSNGTSADLIGMVQDAGLMADGRPILEGLLRLSISNLSMVLSCKESVSSNGFWIRGNAVTLGNCPLSFYREYSADGMAWEAMPDSVWQVSHGYLEGLNPPFTAMLGYGDEIVVIYDFSPPWEFFAGYVGCVFALGIALFVMLCFGAMKKGRQAVVALACTFVLLPILRVAALISSILSCRRADALLFGLWLVYDLANCIYLGCAEWLFIPNELDLIAFSLYLAFMEILDRTAIHANGAGPPMWWIYEITPTRACVPVFVALSLLLLYIRRSTSRWTQTIIRADKAQFTSTWMQYLSALPEEGKTALEAITPLTRYLGATLRRTGSVRQRFRMQSFNAAGARKIMMSCRSRVDNAAFEPDQQYLHGPLVSSLDQLFAQAAGLQHFLIAKVQQWALASKGCFPAESADGERAFVTWESVADDPTARSRVRWAHLKSAERALEKLLRSLHNDPSRLLDCCRQRIVFREPGHLLQCLEAVRDDADVRVVRVKNRLHDGYDAVETAGYRDLLLNLRIDTEETRRLGIETHICEVQLSFCCLVDLISHDSHCRYLILRNIRRSRLFLREILGKYLQQCISYDSGRIALAIPAPGSPEIQNSTGTGCREISVIKMKDQNSTMSNLTLLSHKTTKLVSTNQENSSNVMMRTDSSLVEDGPDFYAPSNQLRRTIESQYILRCQRQPMEKDARLSLAWNAIAKENSTSLLLTKAPLSAAMSRPSFPLFSFFIALFFFGTFLCNAVTYQSQSAVKSRYIRFEFSTQPPCLEINHDSESILDIGESELCVALLLNGFVIDAPSTFKVQWNSSIHLLVSYPHEVMFNGWRLNFDDFNDHPLAIHKSLDGVIWSDLCNRDGICMYERHIMSETTLFWSHSQIHNYHTFDLRIPLYFVLDSMLVPLIGFFLMSTLCLASLQTRYHLSKWIIGAGSLLITACYLISAISCYRSQQMRRASSLVFLAFGSSIWCSSQFLFESRLLNVLLVHGLLLICLHVANISTLTSRLHFFVAGFPAIGYLEFVTWILISVVRLASCFVDRYRRWNECKRYDRVWKPLVCHDSTFQFLTKIVEVTDTMNILLQGTFRQRARNGAGFSCDGMHRGSSGDVVAADTEIAPLVTSLDQLLAQAAGLQHFLIAKVQQWALASKGCFPAESADGERTFVTWESVADDPTARSRVRWAHLKSAERALEKLLRSLHNDPSRLLDCCRQRIVFREPGHLLQCLEAVRDDADVRVVQVKNRLHDGYDAVETAGYRDLLLNLRIDTEETRRLGIETHICELRLGLIAIEILSADDGRLRFLRRPADPPCGH